MAKQPRTCRTCKSKFNASHYPFGGGWYCSPTCKADAHPWVYVGKKPKNPIKTPNTRRRERKKRKQRVKYAQYIVSVEWKIKREEKIKIVGPCCEKCGSTKKHLQVHHLNYKRVGRELMSDLQVLCANCHMAAHGL